jgi:hypothetical protein
MSQLKNCPSCGTLIGAEDPYCPQCGRGPRPPSIRGCLIGFLIALLALIAYAATCSLDLTKGGRKDEYGFGFIGWCVTGVAGLGVLLTLWALVRSRKE